MRVSGSDHGRLFMSVLGIALGISMLMVGAFTLLHDLDTLERYGRLADGADPDGSPDASANPADEASTAPLSALPEEAIAWVEVEGTSIDLPVASGAKGFTWYLTHDLWDRESQLGCPFLDPRCLSEDAAHVIVYGHHVSLTGALFSPLHSCYRQEEFDRLGDCLWSTRTGTAVLAPLCALSVDSGYQGIMRFSFTGQGEFQRWLFEMVSSSTAHCPDARERALHAKRVVTLVTCSSNLAGQPWRTLVLFVG